MKKILVAYDGTPGAELAIKDLVRGGFPERAEARIATFADVWLPPEPPPGDNTGRDHYFTAHSRATDLLEEARETAVAGARHVHQLFPGWSVTNIAKADSPAWGIIGEAKGWEADLITIGSHGRNPLEKFFLGSVSFKVAAEAFCSVRVVRPRERTAKPLQLLVGMDGSSDALRAVEEVLSRNWTPGTEIHLVTAVDPKLKTRILRSDIPGASLDRFEDWIEPILEKYRASFAARELNAHIHLIEGDAKSTLLQSAQKWEVDTIFLGARGVDHGKRLYLGTVASAICTRSNCSVEIVRANSET